MVEKEIERAQLKLRFRADMQILFLRWSNQVQGNLLRDGYTEALAFAHEVDAHFWMFDLRGRGPASAQDEAWILDEFFPSIGAGLAEPTYFAYLLSPKHHAHIHNVVGLARLAANKGGTHIQVFMSESEAVKWLLEKKGETAVPEKS